MVDSWIIASLAPTQCIVGARHDTLPITPATEAAVIPRLYGRMRLGGNIIWATDFREETKTTTQGGDAHDLNIISGATVTMMVIDGSMVRADRKSAADALFQIDIAE